MTRNFSSVRPLLLKALTLFKEKQIPVMTALDLGVGSGEETHLLLSLGYQVTAIDNFEEFLTELYLQERNQPFLNNLKTVHSNFEELSWNDLPQVDLLIAFYSLVFVQPESFNTLWTNIIEHLKPGGFFIGTMHTRSYKNTQHQGYFREEPVLVPFRSKEEILGLFNDFEIIYFENEIILYRENNSLEDTGIYSVIARKN